MAKEMTFMQAVKDFFGLLPNTGNVDFMKEVKQLSDADRVEIKTGLEANGYTITAS